MDSFGPNQDQQRRLAFLAFPSFSRLVEMLGLDAGLFNQYSPPANWVLELRNQTRAAEIGEAVIELALIEATQSGLVAPVLDLLDAGVSSELETGSFEWFAAIRGALASKGITAVQIKAARQSAMESSIPTKHEPPLVEWQPVDDNHLELLMDQQSSLLPINFLSKALLRSHAVAKIEVHSGGGHLSGTGFVIAPNLLVTNAHVIPDKEAARNAKALFNFEKNANDTDIEPLKVALAPDIAFAVSPKEQHDLSVIALAEEPEGRWAALALNNKTLKVDDPVCIIQHPGGDQKHIGLQHNTVTYIDDNLLHYLTDTLPGSSGAPVFDRDWDVVGIHHAGGWMREPATKRTLFRNEGIRVAHLVQLVQSIIPT